MKLTIQGAIITALIGIGITKLFQGRQFINLLKVELKQIYINTKQTKESGFKTLFYTVELVVINPVNFKVAIQSIFIDVLFSKFLFGKAQTIKTIIIEPKKKTIIPVNFAIDLTTLPANLFNVIVEAIDTKKLFLNVKGKINFTEASINFDFNKIVE